MATRQLGFKLVAIGNDKTISDLDKVGKKLDEVAKKISAIQKQPIKLSTAFDTKGLNELLKTLDKVDKAKLNPQIVGTIKELKTQLAALEKQVNNTQGKLEKVSTPELTDTQVNKINGSFIKLNGSAAEVMETISELKPSLANIDDESIRQTYDSLEKVYARLKTLKEEKKVILLDKSASEVETATALKPLLKEQELLIIQKKELEAQSKKSAQAFLQESKNIPVDSIIGMRLELNKLKNEYLGMREAERESAAGQALKTKIQDLSSTVSTAEQSIGDFRRNVGNYQSALSGLLPKLEELQREGILAQKELGDIFKGDLIRREQELRAELEKLGNEFKELGSDIQFAGERARILGIIDDKVRELAATRGTIESMGTSFTRMGQKLASVSDIITGGLIGGGIIATIGALTSFARGSLTEFTQAETAVAKINQQLKITGGLSGQSAEGLESMAKELEVLTGIDGDQILNDVTSGLLKFTKIQGQVFQDAQKAALDLSTALGGDLSGATQLLGKALENPIKGISQLQKAGISLDASAQKQIKTAVEQNDLYKAQSILLTEVNKRFGGLATAVNNTDLQGLRRLTVGFNNFKEAVGKGLVQAGNSIVQFFSDIALGVDVFDESTRTMERGLKSLEKAVSDEVSNIKAVTTALKDESLSREGRNALIQELINKYPGLIDQYDLEYASIGRLDEIQKELTQTVVKQVAERIKAQTKEALVSEQVAKSIEIAQLKAGRLTGAQRFISGLQGGSQDKAVQKFIQEKEQQIKDLQKQINDVDKTFSEYDLILKNALGLPQTEQEGISSTEKLNTRIRAVIGETAKVLQDEKASKAAKNYANNLKKEFKGIEKEIQGGNVSEERRQELIKKAEKGLTKLSDLSKISIDLSKDAADAQAKNQEDAAKALQDQLKRIEDLKRKIQDLNIDAIPNEFDKKIQEVKANTKRQVEDIQKDLDSLELKSIKTNADKIEIEKSKELIKALQEAEGAAIQKIETERTDALKKAAIELTETKNEVLKIIEEINKTEIELKIEQSEFELDQATRTIEIKFQSNADELEKQFDDGVIKTQEEFDRKIAENEIAKLDELEKLYKGYVDEYKKNLDEQYKAEVKLRESIKELDKQRVLTDLGSDIKDVDNDLEKGNIKFEDAVNKKIGLADKANKELKRIDQEFNAGLIELGKQKVEDEQEIDDKITNIVKNGTKARSDIRKKDNEKAKAEHEALLKELKQLGTELLEDVVNTLFEIENAKSQRLFELQRDRINKNYDNQIKAAKGNQAEIERLEREKAQKIEELEKREAKRKKDLAIKEAIIQGALAIIKALPNFLLIPFIVAATALQVARIKAQSFAKGGYAKHGGFTGGSIAPPDETGERPVDAQLHHGEFVSTRKQVNRNSWLYDILEADRKRTNAGAASDLEGQIAEKLLMRRRAIYNLSTPTRKRFEPVIPVIFPIGSSGKAELNISDDQIERMAEIMADKIANKSGTAILEGSSEGIKQATKEALRSERTILRKVI